jgi:uncharacterized protein YnzC (UPF0291/DUF896 family)
MSITKEQIARINALARKSKTAEGLTEQERREQADLRRCYLDSIHENLTAQLDNTYVMDSQGNKRPLGKRE